PLADNGGRTRTHALASTSPAINAGNNANDFRFDQRYLWNTRVVGPAADIGAFELQSSGPTHQVTSCDDDGDGSLRSIVALSQSGDSVDLSALSCSTITLAHGAVEVPQGNLRIVGPGAQALTIDGGNLDRVFHHTGSGTLDVSGLRLINGYGLSETGGLATGGCVVSAGRVVGDDVTVAGCKGHSDTYGCFGGAIGALGIELSKSVVSHNSCTSTTSFAGGGALGSALLTLDRSTVADNIASSVESYSIGGGIAVLGDSTVTASTISGNRADRGGGVFFIRTTMSNSTVSGNAAYGKGGGAYGLYLSMSNSTVASNANTTNDEPAAGGIFVRSSASLQSTIVFGNTMDATPYDFGGLATLLIGANNLIGTSTIIPPLDTITDDPLLGPLADNGGPTLTHALLPGSPAIDRGNDASDLAGDQRGEGFLRVSGDAADIGAFEVQAVTIDDHIFVDGFEPAAR
ncbi:MAG TPA: choice-of-anchor Q domain-containing protein, partial [Rhodanobacteraceae bacterium]|nr:choice-of-anchor Q domain-containing protein [Rhodanobacteraceae bacterium]